MKKPRRGNGRKEFEIAAAWHAWEHNLEDL